MVRAYRKHKPFWIVNASYPMDRFNSDEELERLVGRQAGGSGAGFGARDIDWTFKTGPAADRAAKKLARKRWVRGVEVTKYSDEIEMNVEDSYTVK